MVGLFLVALVLLWKVYQQEAIKQMVHRKLWVYMQSREWIISYAMVRMCQIWKLLLQSGIPLLQILAMTESLWGNLWATQLQHDVKQYISQGHRLTESLETMQLGTSFLHDLLRIGEETGDLESMLQQGYIYYRGILDRTMKKGEQLLEPIMLSIMGLIIAILVVAIMLPMFNSISAIQ